MTQYVDTLYVSLRVAQLHLHEQGMLSHLHWHNEIRALSAWAAGKPGG